MKLYTHPAATMCRPVQLYAAEAGITLETVFVDLFADAHRRPWFIAVNPTGAVPVLEDGAFRLTESSAILKHLAVRAGGFAYPDAPEARARVHEQMDWFNTGFLRQYCYSFVYPQVMPDYGWPDPAMQTAMLARGEAEGRRYLDVLDRHHLGGEGPYLGGVVPTLADFFGAPIVTAGDLIDFDLSPWPKVERWIAAMKARPSWGPVNQAFEGWCELVRGAWRYRIAA